MTTLERLLDSFPFRKMRNGQREALETIASAYDSGTRFVIIEAPPGSGKSGIAKAVTQAFGGYILTPQKMLTRQYIDSFPDIAELKRRANYECGSHGTDCDTGAQLRVSDGACDGCPYRTAKEIFCDARSSTANFAYFLTEKQFVGDIEPRPVLVLDEAHNTEAEILKLIQFDVSPTKALNLGVRFENVLSGDETQDWVRETLLSSAEADYETARDDLKLYPKDKKVLRRAKAADEFWRRVQFFARQRDIADWLLWSDVEGFHARPLSATKYAEAKLFSAAEKMVVILSATILDFKSFRRGLGISESYIELRLPCEFDISNRQILFIPIGSLSKKNKEKNFPAAVDKIRRALNYHPTQKGIIHCHSQEFSDRLRNAMWDERRLIFYDNGDSEEKEKALRRHCETKEPTVLVAQSMHEGLDLKGELSRFQVILKVPYPYLGDRYVQKRNTLNPAWFTWQTALKLVQASGRSIRSEDDWAWTYVFDSDFKTFIKRAKAILPG
jgi:ATP-dependent DNA helicase DinG